MPPAGALDIFVNQEFEECLDLTWKEPSGVALGIVREFVVEMTIDRSAPSSSAAPATSAARKGGYPAKASAAPAGKKEGPLQPPKDAMVKRVSMGKEWKGCIQNMPEGRNFLVRVVGSLAKGGEAQSPWVRASTLHPSGRDADLENLDPMSVPRMNCTRCPCPRYVPLRFEMNTPEKMRCRRCGDHYADHVAVEVSEILKAREARFCKQHRRDSVTPLPSEALEWDNRECALWFFSEGTVHPRRTVGAHRPPISAEAKPLPPGGPEGMAGRKGRVSIVTPTTESRHKFHELLWKCFLAQTWPDKELVVVETYQDHHSAFLERIAQEDQRLVYIKFKRKADQDWSIGLKRNIGAHLATGEVIANFDDDDLYAPAYLTTMVTRLQELKAHAIKLSSWFTYTSTNGEWGFCDPIAWGLTKGLDEEARDVKKWAFGYGFSYVFLRQSGLELWYEDMNLGEDFTFLTQLQARKGPRSVALFHDDFGICLHVQHGGNTSNSIPLRKVDRSEALDLDVMELASHMARLSGATQAPAGGLFSLMEPPSQRSRMVVVHTPEGNFRVSCAISATASEFLQQLRREAGSSAEGLLLHRVPLRLARRRGEPEEDEDEDEEEVSEETRDKVAADVLGIAFLAALDGAAENLQPESKSGRQWRKLLEQAKRPMHSQDRIGLRTAELWAVPPDPNAAQEAPEETYEDEDDYFTVKVTCQKSNVKQFFTASHAFSVRVPLGATVATMREVLGYYLPQTAKVLAERQGKGLVTLQEADALPEEVTVSEFKGNRGLYMVFSKKQCIAVLSMQVDFFSQPATQAQIDQLEQSAGGNETLEYRAALVKLLSDECYPSILKRFNVPEQEMSPKFFVDAMRDVSHDFELCELWLQVERLMRNTQGVVAAENSIRAHLAKMEGAGGGAGG